MAKITYAKLLLKEKFSEHCFSNDIVAEVKLYFSKDEIQANVQFNLHLFLYRENRDDKQVEWKKNNSHSAIHTDNITQGHLLAYQNVLLCANRSTRVFKRILCPIDNGNAFLNGVKVFATLIPVEVVESKWSNSYFFDIILK